MLYYVQMTAPVPHTLRNKTGFQEIYQSGGVVNAGQIMSLLSLFSKKKKRGGRNVRVCAQHVCWYPSLRICLLSTYTVVESHRVNLFF